MIYLRIDSEERMEPSDRVRLLNLLSTPQGTVPYMRDFGIPLDVIDAPMPQAINTYVNVAAEAVAKWLPHLRLKSITPSGDRMPSGEIIYTVEVGRNG